MKRQKSAGILFLLACTLILTNFASAAEPDAANPEEPVTWKGVIKNDSLRDLAPKEGHIADQETWAKVWMAWKSKAELPKIDFTKEIVLVTTVPGPNRTMGKPTKDDEGNVKFLVASTRMAGPGFGYMMAKISTVGVKTINGKPFDPSPKATVTGTIVVPKDVSSFEGSVAEIRLYKMHPLPPTHAPKETLVDEVEIKDYSHTKGKETNTDFVIGGNENLERNLKYHVTLFVFKDGKRTHMGKVPGKFLCKVLTNGEPSTVKFTVGGVRRY